MKRIALVALLVCSMVLGTRAFGVVQASSHNSLLESLRAPRLIVAGHSASQYKARANVEKAPSHQTGSQLALPASAFSPAVLNQQYVGTLDNATADQSFFAYYHSSTFEALGRITGYYMRADWTPSGASDVVVFRYQANVFASAAAAQSAWQDSVTHTTQVTSSTSTDCTSSAGANCAIIKYEAQAGPVKYVTIQVNQCTAEMASTSSDATGTANDSAISQTLVNILSAALTTLQSACSGSSATSGPPPTTVPPTTGPLPTVRPSPTRALPPTRVPTPPTTSVNFEIISVLIEKPSAKPDWKQAKPPIKAWKAGSKIRPTIYVNVTSGAPGQAISLNFHLSGPGGTILNKTYSGTLDAKNPADTYRFRTPTNIALPKAGNYSLTARMTIGPRTKQGSFGFQTVSRVAPPPPAVSFSFNSLQLVNPANQPTSRFKPGQAVGVVYHFSVRNVKSTVPLTVIRTYQFLSSHGWVPIGHPVPEYSDTSNGTHTFKVVSVPNPTYKQQRVVVGITIGRSYAEKIAAFAIQ